MQDERIYQTAIQIFEIVKNDGKNYNKNSKIIQDIFWILQKRRFKEYCLLYVYKISKLYLEEWPTFAILNVQNGHFHAICDTYIFFIFKIYWLYLIRL